MKWKRIFAFSLCFLLVSCQEVPVPSPSPSSSPSLSPKDSTEEDPLGPAYDRPEEPSFVFLPLPEKEGECGVYVEKGIGTVAVPETSPDGKKVTKFLQPKGPIKGDLITEIVFPDGLNSLQPFALMSYPGLLRVSPPDALEPEDGLFYGCKNLMEVHLPHSWKDINWQAFRYCTNLRLVELPEGMERIHQEAFHYCGNLEFVKLPEATKGIGDFAFGDCLSLTRIRLPESLEETGDYVFQDCLSLTDVTIDDGVAMLGEGTFSGCALLHQVFLPSSVQTIGRNCFRGCADDLTIYCEASKKPEGWDENFCDEGSKILWGVKRDEVPVLR